MFVVISLGQYVLYVKGMRNKDIFGNLACFG